MPGWEPEERGRENQFRWVVLHRRRTGSPDGVLRAPRSPPSAHELVFPCPRRRVLEPFGPAAAPRNPGGGSWAYEALRIAGHRPARGGPLWRRTAAKHPPQRTRRAFDRDRWTPRAPRPKPQQGCYRRPGDGGPRVDNLGPTPAGARPGVPAPRPAHGGAAFSRPTAGRSGGRRGGPPRVVPPAHVTSPGGQHYELGPVPRFAPSWGKAGDGRRVPERDARGPAGGRGDPRRSVPRGRRDTGGRNRPARRLRGGLTPPTLGESLSSATFPEWRPTSAAVPADIPKLPWKRIGAMGHNSHPP